MITVSVIIPVYNEETTILEILRRVNTQKPDRVRFEVLVVDDGSRDRTVELIERSAGLYNKLIKRTVNGGKGAAVRDGLGAATGDYVLFQDADLEYDPADYATLLQPVLDFDADVVMGSRQAAMPNMRLSYYWHKVGNQLITFIFNVFNNTNFTDMYSCYLVYRRRLVDPRELVTNGWDQHAEILSKAVSRASKIYEVPVSYHARTYAEGKKIKARHAMAVIWAIVAGRLFR